METVFVRCTSAYAGAIPAKLSLWIWGMAKRPRHVIAPIYLSGSGVAKVLGSLYSEYSVTSY